MQHDRAKALLKAELKMYGIKVSYIRASELRQAANRLAEAYDRIINDIKVEQPKEVV